MVLTRRTLPATATPSRNALQFTDDKRLRYQPAQAELDVMVRCPAETYESRRIEIIELLIANAPQRIRPCRGPARPSLGSR